MNRLRFYGYLALSTFAESVSPNGWFRHVWRRQFTHHQCAVLSLMGLVFSSGPPVETASADTFGSGSNSFAIEFVTIGSPGNPPDANPNPAGAVPYEHRIGKYEISEQMIDKANALGGIGITKDTRGPDKPATSVSWNEAARFVNWLNTNTGSTPAYKFDVSGNFQLWQPSDPGYNPTNLYRNSLARYFLPSVNEWYKAAYYDPVAGVYYDYPTGSDLVPDGIDFAGDAIFDAVFFDGASNVEPNHVLDVGQSSAFGTAGQGGNVREWVETAFDRVNNLVEENRRDQGGSISDSSNALAAWNGIAGVAPQFENGVVGFRVAAIVPEPASILLQGIAQVFLFGQRMRVFGRQKGVRNRIRIRFLTPFIFFIFRRLDTPYDLAAMSVTPARDSDR